MDRLTVEQRKKNMQAVKSKGSQLELILNKALWGKGYRFQKTIKEFWQTDIVFRKLKIAIFVDSEFWHGKIGIREIRTQDKHKILASKN